MINVVLVEDNVEMCNQIKHILEESEKIKVIGVFHDIKSASENIPKLKPDIILMDLSLPDGNGITYKRMQTQITRNSNYNSYYV